MYNTVPGPPTNLVVVDTGPHHVALSWDDVEPSQRNGMIRYYLIYVTPVESSSATVETVTSYSTSHNLTALHPYTTYYITVAAFTIALGSNSSILSVRTDTARKLTTSACYDSVH